MIYLVDIDGTISDLTHRLHFIQNKPQDWKSFFVNCHNDLPIDPVVKTVQLLKQAGATILMSTGRSDIIREQTLNWLKKHNVPCDEIYMRKEGDHREDYVVKSEILDHILLEYDQSDIIAVLEDRAQVCSMYRQRGLRVLQVAEGNY